MKLNRDSGESGLGGGGVERAREQGWGRGGTGVRGAHWNVCSLIECRLPLSADNNTAAEMSVVACRHCTWGNQSLSYHRIMDSV